MNLYASELYRSNNIDLGFDMNQYGYGSHMNFDIWETDSGSIHIGSGIYITTYSDTSIIDEYDNDFGIGWEVVNLTYMSEYGLYARVSPVSFMIADKNDAFRPSIKCGWIFGSDAIRWSPYIGVDLGQHRYVYGGINFWFTTTYSYIDYNGRRY